MQRLGQIQTQLVSNSPAPLVEISTLDGNIGVLGMNSSSNLNALSLEMRAELCAGLLKFERDPKIKVVLLRSNIPKGFCAGANIKEFKPADYHARMLVDNFKELSISLETFRKPLICSVNRFAFGGGFELCCAADVIVCDEGCNFGFPEITLGIFPGIGGTLISKSIGKSRAMEMILTGKKVSAQQMMDWGMVNHIYKKEDLRAKSEAFAREFAVKSGQSLILAKSAVKFGYENSSESGRLFERRVFDSLWSGLAGVQEGIDAFKNKRKPNFDDM